MSTTITHLDLASTGHANSPPPPKDHDEGSIEAGTSRHPDILSADTRKTYIVKLKEGKDLKRFVASIQKELASDVEIKTEYDPILFNGFCSKLNSMILCRLVLKFHIVSCGDEKTVEVIRDKEEVEDVRGNELFECVF